MSGKWCWVKRRWFDFRQGHNVYLSFIPSLSNFLMLSFNFFFVAYLGLTNDPFTLALFALGAGVVYVPLAVVVGNFHNKKQLGTDSEIAARANPLFMQILDNTEKLQKQIDELKKILEAKG